MDAINMNKQQLIDEVFRLNELLRISTDQAIGFSEQISELEIENQELKKNLFDTSVEKAALEELVIDFEEPFQAAEDVLTQMNGLRIEKVVTFANECTRMVRERLQEKTSIISKLTRAL